MRISFKALARRALDLGFDLSLTDANVYQIKKLNDWGTTFDGTYDEVRCWLLGLEFARQESQSLTKRA